MHMKRNMCVYFESAVGMDALVMVPISQVCVYCTIVNEYTLYMDVHVHTNICTCTYIGHHTTNICTCAHTTTTYIYEKRHACGLSTHINTCACISTHEYTYSYTYSHMGWLRLVGSLKS